ncbi:hypothetical protein JHK86_000953 [Glycine max]|nr:hypothetical protein JHK86_000953 [Glycine max]
MGIPTVLALPYPAQGHVNPLMTLSQKLVEHGCKVFFVNTDFDHKRVVSSMVEQQDHSLDESLLKLVSIPDGLGPDDDRNDLSKLCDSLLNNMPAMLEKLMIEDIHFKGDNRISLIVADVCMGWALDVGSKLGIKGALLCPSSAAFFALLYNVPRLIDDGIIDSDGGLRITTQRTIQISQGMPEMDPRELSWLNMGNTINGKIVLNYLMQYTQRLNMTEWWLCNTTYELEHAPLSSIPKLVPIGPLLRSYGDTIATAKTIGQYWEEDLSCMSWLDQQPHGSVLYVAFGSFTHFDQNQFNELALGLDLTNRPFLWVVHQDNKRVYPNEFLACKGKIVSWAPQQKCSSALPSSFVFFSGLPRSSLLPPRSSVPRSSLLLHFGCVPSCSPLGCLSVSSAIEVEDEVLLREEASSACVLGDENGVSGRRCSSAGIRRRTFLVSSKGARGRTPSSADSIFVLSHSRKNTFFRRLHFLLAEEPAEPSSVGFLLAEEPAKLLPQDAFCCILVIFLENYV